MSIQQAVLADLSTVKNISEPTISEVYPHYYPKGAVDFFLEHHSEEDILTVCKRFINSGMTPERIPERMGVPIKFVNACMR